MNRQDTKTGRGIEWTQTWGVYPGYTSNPVFGCTHDCRWLMPDGKVAICYAESIAEKFRMGKFKDIRLKPEELTAIRNLKHPSGIFVGSMADVLGVGVPDEAVQQIIDTMRECSQHIFYILTKNPPRLLDFSWPENAWVGVSAPPSFMFGNELTLEQQTRWYDKALTTLGKVDVPVRWTSIEPLAWDVSKLIESHWRDFEWAVIGAATDGAKTHQPDTKLFNKTWKALGGKPVFLKGNIDMTLAQSVCGGWLEQWPLPTSDWREARLMR